MSAGRCTFCSTEINPDQDYRRVTGWERHRSQGGTKALRGRETHDEWACRWCVDKLAKGIAPGQNTLL